LTTSTTTNKEEEHLLRDGHLVSTYGCYLDYGC
jgi:hypothetical protein